MNGKVFPIMGEYILFVLSVIVFVLSSKVISSLPVVFGDGNELGFRILMLGWSIYVVVGFVVAFVGTVLYVVARFLFGGKALVVSLILPVTVAVLLLSMVLTADLASEDIGVFVDELFVTGIVVGSFMGGGVYYFSMKKWMHT